MAAVPRRGCASRYFPAWKPFFFAVLLALCSKSQATEQTAQRETISGHARMLALLEEIRVGSSEEHMYLTARGRGALKERLAGLPPRAPDIVRLELHLKLGEAEQTLGHEQEAIHNFTEAYRLLPKVREEMAPEWITRLLYRLGMAHLRVGETRNCHQRNSPDSCLLPIRGGGIHEEQEPSRQAIEYFTECLAQAEEGSDPYFSARWLLNIAYMTVGAHPDEVPPEYLIPPSAFESEEPFPRFANVGQRAGLDTFSLAGGAVAEDFDQDGDLDLLVSTFDPSGQVRLFINNEDGSFSDYTRVAGLEGIYGALNMVQADYDNDGDADVLMLRGGWMAKQGRHPNSLLRNNGDGTFTDVTFEVGLGEVHYPTQTASWADFDNDGDLDLYVGNETTPELRAPCQLFLNQGDGTFTDVALSAGIANGRFTKAVVWGDYNGDGWQDLYVSNIHGANRLYHNNGDGTFTDVAASAGVTGPEASFPAWFWDFDNDGALDLYVSAYQATIGRLAAAHLGMGYTGELARLYRGDGRGGFLEVAQDRNLTRPNAPMGSNFGDLDNDGFLDFYLGTGFPPYHSLMPNVMYWNRGGQSFRDVSTAGGFAHLQKGHAVIFADFDHDGDQDIFEQMGGFFAGDKFGDALYENPGFGNHWITVELLGVESNRSAIGTRIRVQVREDGQTRTIYKHVNSGGTFGANPLRQTMGLGKADGIESLEVFWPASDRTQTFRDVPMDRFIQILEIGDRFWILASGREAK